MLGRPAPVARPCRAGPREKKGNPGGHPTSETDGLPMRTVAVAGTPMALLRVALMVALPLPAISGAVPTGLLVDFQPAPALGVAVSPGFGWIVPACAGAKNAMQTAYEIVVRKDGAAAGDATIWDSGKVASNASVAVKYGGPSLDGGMAYEWTVKTWTTSGCASESSAPALFITALAAFHPDARWIGAGTDNATFNLVRRVVKAPTTKPRRVVGYITAQNSDPTMLMNYKLYINGALASVGPGRGEAPVTGGDGRFRSQPYVTVDLTKFFMESGSVLLALQTMEFGGFEPCHPHKECNGATQISHGPAVLMQIDVHQQASGAPKTSWVTEAATWKAWNADPWFRPANKDAIISTAADGPGGRRGQQCVLRETRPFFGNPCEPEALLDRDQVGSAGTGRMEFTDARNEPIGWRDNASFDDHKWPAAVAISSPSLVASELTPRMAGAPVQIIPSIQPVRTAPSGTDMTGHRDSIYAALGKNEGSVGGGSSFFVDFGKEFQGGLKLTVKDGAAGQTVKLTSGEMCTPFLNNNSKSCNTVQQNWQWEFTWTLRAGEQKIEQHQYMEFRYLQVEFSGATVAADAWSVEAWGVQAPWEPSDTHFTSTNTMLNKVWELSAYTLQAAVTDTYADSNTRERRPYVSADSPRRAQHFCM